MCQQLHLEAPSIRSVAGIAIVMLYFITSIKKFISSTLFCSYDLSFHCYGLLKALHCM